MYTHPEALRIACGMERRGIELYTRASRIIRGEEMHRLLTQLAEDEKAHLAHFERMYAACMDQAVPVETDAYLGAVAADVAFPGGLFAAAAGGSLESEQKLLEYAAESERSSIAFYGELMKDTEDDETAQTLNDIIHQEQGHLVQLEKRIK